MSSEVSQSTNLAVIVITAIFGGLIVIITFLWRNNNKSVELATEEITVDSEKWVDQKPEPTKTKKKQASDRKWNDAKANFYHEFLLSTLKGHAGNILGMDFSSNGKYLLSCSEDRCVMLWSCRDFSHKEHKSVKVNIEFDHAAQAKWSPDSKAFIINQATANRLQVYKVGRKSDGSLGNVSPAFKFPKHHEADINSIGIACNGKFILTSSNDTALAIWNLRGELLTVIDTLQVNNYYACVSPCGRFVASSGFTPDVKVWEVCFDKSSTEFKETVRAFELKGHRAGVLNFAFNNDSSRMVTVSKDGTWKLWDTKVEYQKNQEPYLLLTSETKTSTSSHIALSPDGRAVVIASRSNLYFFSGITGELDFEIPDVHTANITSLCFSPDGKYVLSSGGRHIRIFHNVVGYRATIADLKQKKIDANSQTIRDRIEDQIIEAKKYLQEIQTSKS